MVCGSVFRDLSIVSLLVISFHMNSQTFHHALHVPAPPLLGFDVVITVDDELRQNLSN